MNVCPQEKAIGHFVLTTGGIRLNMSGIEDGECSFFRDGAASLIDIGDCYAGDPLAQAWTDQDGFSIPWHLERGAGLSGFTVDNRICWM